MYADTYVAILWANLKKLNMSWLKLTLININNYYYYDSFILKRI